MSNENLTIEVRAPVWDTNNFIRDYGMAETAAYSHTNTVNIGYDTAEISLPGGRRLENWLDWLGYDITVYSEGGVVIWEGFVNEVEYGLGGIQVKRGPLLSIGNKVKVKYRTLQYNTNPPIGGEAAETAFASDTESQDAYGILETIVAGGSGTSTEMTQLRDTFLAENRLPETAQRLNVGSVAAAEIRVRCLGYAHLLDRFFYSNSATGTINASARVTDILDAAPSVTYNYDNGTIETNTLQVPDYGDGEKTGMGEIRSIVELGDTSDNRFIFGVYAHITAHYSAIPTDVQFFYKVYEKAQRLLYRENEGVVHPWEVRPGQWVLVPDFLPGQGEPSNLREDVRAIFMESVQYTAPYGLQIEGGKTGKVSQKLAKIHMGIR